MKIDLHAHSTCSDGKESVSTVFAEAKLAGIDVLALTDHDTTHGWAEAAVAAKNEGIGFVPGIEVSTRVHLPETSFGMHMLAYLPDPNHAALKYALEETVLSREKRLQSIVELVSADYNIEWQDVLDELEEGATPGRPAVADALIKKGHFAHRNEVFEEIWVKTKKYSVPNRGVPDTMDAIDTFKMKALDSMKQTSEALEKEVEKSKGYIARAEGQAQATKSVQDSGLLSLEA